jgi:DNA-binding transcriptional regulator GbsR (MarR family)
LRKTSASGRREVLAWVERVAAFFVEQYGLPPITGRVIGWLLICEPPTQSAGEIADAIGASRASLTTTLRFLVTSGFVQRRRRPGDRTTYYGVDDNMWETVIQRRIASMVSFSEITIEGMSLVGPSSRRADRLRAARQFFGWMAMLLANPARRPSK